MKNSEQRSGRYSERQIGSKKRAREPVPVARFCRLLLKGFSSEPYQTGWVGGPADLIHRSWDASKGLSLPCFFLQPILP